jgi:hypothetical protein
MATTFPMVFILRTAQEGDKTELRFTHVGLVPAIRMLRGLFTRMGLLYQRQFAAFHYYWRRATR